jgi:hypothetical protein
MAVFCGIAGLLLLTDAAVMATMRYEADFAPILFIAAALTTAGLLSCSRGLSRSVLYSFTAVALTAGMVVNACIAFTGYYDELRRKAPEQYVFLEHLLSPGGPKLLGMFPNGTTTGKGFLLQPDGTSALGVVCANAGSDPVVVFDSKPLPTSMSFDRNCMLSATVPPGLYTKPGSYPVFIRNSYGESNQASFVVAPAGP